MSKEAMTREKFFSEMQRIEDGLLTADALGVSPPQNWTTVAAERILSLRDDAARYRWLRQKSTVISWIDAGVVVPTGKTGSCFARLECDQLDAAIDKARAAQEVAG